MRGLMAIASRTKVTAPKTRLTTTPKVRLPEPTAAKGSVRAPTPSKAKTPITPNTTPIKVSHGAILTINSFTPGGS